MKVAKRFHTVFLGRARKRKTTYEFSGRKVSLPVIVSVLEAARMAPSCDNSQPWYFIVVRDKAVITKLMYLVNYGYFHTDPNVIIAIVLDKGRCAGQGHSCFRGDKYGRYDSWLSTGMAALNMAYQAQSLSVGSCFLTPRRDAASRILGLKKGDVVSLLVGFGYEKKGAYRKPKERRALEEQVFWERYGKK